MVPGALGGCGRRQRLPAIGLEAEVLVKELHDVILKAIGYGAGVRAVVELKAVGESVAVEDIVQLAGVDAQAVLVADVHRDAVILPQVADVLVDKSQRSIGSPLRLYVWLWHTVLSRQIGVKRRVLGIR